MRIKNGDKVIVISGKDKGKVGNIKDVMTAENKVVVDGVQLSFHDPLIAKYRSKTYPGIAKAMADQWSTYIERGEQK